VARRPDIPALVAGLVLLAFGGVLMLDAAGAIDLSLEWYGPLATGSVGTILVANGLSR
jgi:hypothetical protein